ncbi:MAG TPA: 1-(5-phosphoribosyl)-5-[(5-phosphoribosylamino)methylideneamino] imidazole-4-carboxamide isomerase [Actinomycetota bacterium]
MIVVPAIDLRGGRCVRLLRGDPGHAVEYGDDPVAMARRFEDAGAPMLHVVDLDAALEEGDNRAAILSVCESVSIPVQTGGGLHQLQDVDRVLALGAARAVLGTAAVRDPSLVRRAVERHGDRIVVAVDTRDGRVMIRGWRDAAGPLERFLPVLEAAGAPRFLVTSIGSDGTLEGPDLPLYHQVLELTGRPLIASGGVADAGDLAALAGLGVEAAVVGKALYEGTLTLAEAVAVTRR